MSDNIIADLGLQEWPEEKRLKLITDLAALAEKRVMIRMIQDLNEVDAKNAEALANDPEQLLVFLSSKHDIAKLINDETDKLKNELMLEAHEDAPIPEA